MKNITYLLLFLASFPLVIRKSFCGFASAPSAQAAADLAGTSWQLVRFEDSNGQTQTPDAKNKYTVAFESDGMVSVRIDCNRGRGTWKSAGPNQLQFGPLALTRAMCLPAPLNDYIPKDWERLRSYTLKDGHLFLSLMADGGTYEFEPISPEANPPASPGSKLAAPLENTYWKLISLGGTPVMAPSQQREPHLTLNSESRRVGGSGGCNALMGSYKLRGDHLIFRQMATTMMACLQGMDTEKAFLKALTQARTWKISGEQLDLFDGSGHSVARLEARPTQ